MQDFLRCLHWNPGGWFSRKIIELLCCEWAGLRSLVNCLTEREEVPDEIERTV